MKIALVIEEYSKGIEWNQGDLSLWSLNCDFEGNDISKEKLKEGEDCAVKCEDTPGCTHYSAVNDYCFKKKGSISQTDAINKLGVVCGILKVNFNFKGLKLFLYYCAILYFK